LNLNALPMQSGNFVPRASAGARDVYAAETDYVRKAVVDSPRWNEARTKHSAVFISA
jgi:hypothetical protein